MTSHDFYTLWGAALESADRDTYIAEWGTSSIFDPDPEQDAPDFDIVIAQLGSLWDIAHAELSDIRKRAGMTQTQLAERFCVSRRTVEAWEQRKNCPAYTRLMMAECLGLIER